MRRRVRFEGVSRELAAWSDAAEAPAFASALSEELGDEVLARRIRWILDPAHFDENEGVFDAVEVAAFATGGQIVATMEDARTAFVALFRPGEDRSPVISFRFDDPPDDFVWESDSLAAWRAQRTTRPDERELRSIERRYRRSIWLGYALGADFAERLPPEEACRDAGSLDELRSELDALADDPSSAFYWLWHHALLGNGDELAGALRSAADNPHPLIRKLSAALGPRAGRPAPVLRALPSAKRAKLRDGDAWLSDLRSRVGTATRGEALSAAARAALVPTAKKRRSLVRKALAQLDALGTPKMDEKVMLEAIAEDEPGVLDLVLGVLERADFGVFTRRIALAAIERAATSKDARFVPALERLAEHPAVDVREGSRARVAKALAACGDDASIARMWARTEHARAELRARGSIDDALAAASSLVGVVPRRCDASVVAAGQELLDAVLAKSELSRHEVHVIELVVAAFSAAPEDARASLLTRLRRPWPPATAPAAAARAMLEQRITSLRSAVGLDP